MVTDLTKEHPDKTLWRFWLPMMFSVAFQQIYNIADSMIAGRFAGEDALAAVGASYPITVIFMAFAVGMNLGASVIVSRLFGAGDRKGVKRAVTTAFASSLSLAVILTVYGYFFCRNMMEWIHTPQNIMQDGVLYLKIYVFGLIFLMLYNVCTGIFTALGDSRTPLWFLLGSSAGNIVLDLLFVAKLHWGVAGVAWATFIAQGIACVLAFITLLGRLKGVKTRGEVRFFSGEMLKKVSLIAVPSILQQSFISIGNIFIQGIINSYGSSVIAGYSAAVKLNTFTITSFTTLGNGLSSFTAQNVGAGAIDRVKKGYKAGVKMALMVAVPFFILFFFLGTQMISLFMDEGGTLAMSTGVQFLRIVAPFYFVVSMKLMADGVLRGAGAMTYFMIATFTDLILRVVLSFVLSAMFGTVGVWLSWPIGWTIATIMSLYFYFTEKWNPIKELEKELEPVVEEMAEEAE